MEIPSGPAAACDILIIGGGPAGATAAVLPLLDRLGVAEKVRAIGTGRRRDGRPTWRVPAHHMHQRRDDLA